MYTFAEWKTFTFGLSGRPSLEFDPYPGSESELLNHCLTFLLDGQACLSNVPRGRIEQALAQIPSIDGYLGILSLHRLPKRNRAELAASQLIFFRDVFFFDSYGAAAFMWWEWLPGASYADGACIHNDPDMCSRLIEVIEKILYLPSPICQKSALHGLNEIGPYVDYNPRPTVINYLRSFPLISNELKQYALDVANQDAR